jgi:hypothetical protein
LMELCHQEPYGQSIPLLSGMNKIDQTEITKNKYICQNQD